MDKKLLYGAHTALVTPMKDGAVSYTDLGSLLDRQLASGISGVVPCGTTGESPTLSHGEHLKVISETIDQVEGRIPVIAGTGANSTEEAIHLTGEADKAGADGFLLVAPYYNKPSQEGLMAHFSAFTEGGEKEPPKSSEEASEKKESSQTSASDTSQEEESDPSAEIEEAREPRDWLKVAYRTGIGLSVATVCLLAASFWIQFSLPHWLPPQWLEARGAAAIDIQPGNPTTQPDYDALIESLNSKKGRLEKCQLDQQSLSVYMVVQPNGRVSAAGSSYLPVDQRRCVRQKLLGMVLKRRSRSKPLRIRTTVVF